MPLQCPRLEIAMKDNDPPHIVYQLTVRVFSFAVWISGLGKELYQSVVIERAILLQAGHEKPRYANHCLPGLNFAAIAEACRWSELGTSVEVPRPAAISKIVAGRSFSSRSITPGRTSGSS